MAQNKLKEIHALSDWQAQVLRCTAFYDPAKQFDISGWWLEITGHLPETETKRAMEGISIEEGTFEKSKLTLTKSPLIVDLRYQLPDKQLSEVNVVPTIGNFEEKCPEFVSLVKKLFDVVTFPWVTRLAFGSFILLPVKDRQKGYNQLSEYIKNVKINSVNSSDFMYRINRRRTSKTGIEGLAINRLNTWSVASYQAVTASLGTGKMTKTVPNYACQLEIDINTCQEFQDCLPKEKLGIIFDELVDMGKEIITKGDIE